MLLISSTDPSPLAQVAVYMVGVLLGHALLTEPEEWQRAWETVRETFRGKRRDY